LGRRRKSGQRLGAGSTAGTRTKGATELRREFRLEAAQILLGHSKADVTQVYAERDVSRAAAAAGKIGWRRPATSATADLKSIMRNLPYVQFNANARS